MTYNIYRNSTSPVPIDAGHLVTSGITETSNTDCGRSPQSNGLAVWRGQTAG